MKSIEMINEVFVSEIQTIDCVRRNINSDYELFIKEIL